MSEKLSIEESPAPPPPETSTSQEINHDLHHANDFIDLKNTLSKREKWFIVILIASSAFFSPFTANIYFPAIPTIARAFKKPIELINLSVTVYVVLQGTSPMFWGTMSDNMGRRPIAAACLLLLILSCVGLALVPASAYWLLMLLRCIQAAGSASTLAIGAGVISDISTPAERGGFYGVYALGPMAGPALGPVLGGILTQGLGWRAIFWFLCIAVSLCLVVLLLFLPETLPTRQSPQSGLKILYKPVIPIIGLKPSIIEPSTPPKIATVALARKFQNPLLIFGRYNILLLLVINATSFAVFFGIVTSLSILFERTYPFLNELQIGFCFLSAGGTMAGGTGIIGRILDWRYKVEKNRLRRRLHDVGELEKRLGEESVKEVDKLPEFPLERARLSFLPASIFVMAGCTAGYGWSLQFGANLAVPLILQAFIGLVCMAVMNATTTLMIDLAPGQGSAVQACSNFVRCGLSAVVITIIQPIINGIGVGWTYVLFAGFVLTSLPWFYLEIRLGPRWRAIAPGSKSSTSDTTRKGELVSENP